MGASLSKLNELWQEYKKHKPYVHMFLCVHVNEPRKFLRVECVIRFVEVRGGYKAMNGGVHMRYACRRGGAKQGTR